MSDIDDWLRAHEEELAQIARGTDLESSLVHLAAVLVLAGIEDAQIYDQLHALVVSLDGQRHPFGRGSTCPGGDPSPRHGTPVMSKGLSPPVTARPERDGNWDGGP